MNIIIDLDEERYKAHWNMVFSFFVGFYKTDHNLQIPRYPEVDFLYNTNNVLLFEKIDTRTAASCGLVRSAPSKFS